MDYESKNTFIIYHNTLQTQLLMKQKHLNTEQSSNLESFSMIIA